MDKRTFDTRKIAVLAMLSAIASVLMLVVRLSIIPAAPFLIYDPKDIIIVIGGFIYGPLAVIPMAIIVAFVEMVTVSADGWVGFLMNVISTLAFACTAALIYKRIHSVKGAILGLVVGVIFTTVIMILWNYIITPGYRGVPRAVIVAMIPTVFLPFNLIKYGLSAATAMLVYKPLSIIMKKTGILKESEQKPMTTRSIVVGVITAICLAVVPAVLLILVIQGVI